MIQRSEAICKEEEKMILLNDLEFLSDIAENKTGLYNMITEELRNRIND